MVKEGVRIDGEFAESDAGRIWPSLAVVKDGLRTD